MEPAACPVCGDSATRPLWDLGSFSFHSCRGCGHVYQNPRPNASDLEVRYDEEYLGYEIENAEAFLDLMLLGLRDIGFPELESALPRPRRFLDVGCATGTLVEYLGQRGWDCEGVEVCGPAAEYGRSVRKVKIFQGTLAEAGYPDASFDIVHASHVIEHIAEPGEFLSEISRVLKPGGYSVMVTPNVNSLQARLFGPGWRSAIADHVHLFSLPGLVRILDARGLKPTRWKTWGGMAQGLAEGWIKTTLDRAAKFFGFGDVMVVLAEKTQASGLRESGAKPLS